MKVLNLKGVVVDDEHKEVYEWFGIEAVCPKDIISQLNAGEPVEVEIDSIGGSIAAGSTIFTALKSHTGKVTTKIVARAYSIASIVAMAGDEIVISPTALFMIHNASLGGFKGGDYRAFEQRAEMLKTATDGLAQIYVERTGKTAEEIAELMNKETFFNAQQTVENGFADRILFASAETLGNEYALSASATPLLTPEQFEQFKNRNVGNDMKMQLELLKLKTKN